MLTNYSGKYSMTGGNAVHQDDFTSLKYTRSVPRVQTRLTWILRAGLMIALEDLYLSRLTGVNLGHEIIPDRRDFYPAAASPVTGQVGRQEGRLCRWKECLESQWNQLTPASLSLWNQLKHTMNSSDLLRWVGVVLWTIASYRCHPMWLTDPKCTTVHTYRLT